MAKILKLETTKTYDSEANAIKAVEKKYPVDADDGLDYLVLKTEGGRYCPVFIGSRAIYKLVHFDFHVVM